MTGLQCCRCWRAASNAVSVEAGTLLLCERHHGALAAALHDDPRVQVGRRVVVLEAPVLEAVRR